MKVRISVKTKLFVMTMALFAAALWLSASHGIPAFQLTSSAKAQQACVSPPAGMKLWMPFDETSGAVAHDIAGVNNIGVYGLGTARPTPTPGKVAGALRFDGPSDYVEVAHAADIDVLNSCDNDAGESFTVDAWIKTSSQVSLQTILDKRVVSSNGPIGYSLFLSNGRVGFQMATGSAGFSNFVAPTAPVNDGNWHFIAVTIKRCRMSAGKIYVNGNLVHSFSPLSGNMSNNANLIIGKRQPAFGENPFDGAIDELEIFKRDVSEAELDSIFAADSAGKCKNNCEPRACDLPGFTAPAYYDSFGTNPTNFTFGDFDGDGIPDLVDINRNSNTASILTGNSDGTFNTPPKTTISTGTTPTAAIAGDFNKDGKLDLAVAIQSPANVVILIGKGDGTFDLTVSSFSVGGSPNSIVTLDFNGDDKLDLAVANNAGVRLLAGNGDGTFTTGALLTALNNPLFVTKGDFNLDNRTDLVVANLTSPQVSVFVANTSGGFNPVLNLAVESGANDIAVADIDLDGDLDLAVSSPFTNVASILLGDGAGGFAAYKKQSLANASGAIALGDLTGDGIPELIVADTATGALVVLKGKGDGTFSPATSFGLTGTSLRIVVGDFNQDGKNDLAANVPAGNRVAILLNNCTASVPVITVTPTSLNTGTVGQVFTQSFSASGGMGPYTYMQTSGTLPAGVTLQSDGTLTGTPEKPGTYTFTVKATDKNGCMGTVTITWRVFCPTITITPATVHDGTAGLNYLPVEQLTASGGTPVYTFLVTSGLLPTGMTLTNDGKLQGTPMQSGSFTFVVTVTDKFGCTGVREYTLVINCQTLTIGPENMTLPDAMQEAIYNPAQPPQQTFTATGGCGQFTFSISSGMLPAGMTLQSNGALTGTPTQNGEFEFTVKVTDKCGCMATKTYTLKVSCPLRSLLNTKLFNTGVDGTAKPLPTPTPDAHYGLTYGINSLTPLAVKELNGWLPNTSASQWIAPFANYSGESSTVYTYRTFFSLDKCDPNTTRIEGQWAADNGGEIWLNGAKVLSGAIPLNMGFKQWQSFTIDTTTAPSGFGESNTLEFRVTNESGPTGLRVEFIRAFAKCCDCVDRPAGMKAWWPLDEPKGAVVVNDVAGGNHGKPKPGGAVGVAAPNSIPGKVAGAMRFFPSRFIEVPHNLSLDFGPGSFSMDAWVRAAGAPGNKNVIVDKLDLPGKRGYRFSLQSNALVLEIGDSNSVQTFTSASTVGFSQWRFVAVTVDRSAQVVRFYADNGTGSLLPIGSSPIPAAFGIIVSGVNLRIGLTAAQGHELFDIDELELFGRSLPFTELEGIFKAGPAGKCKTCVMPKVTLHPVSQKVCPGKDVVLTAAASGSPVPVVQWQVMVGSGPWTDIPNATATTLLVTAAAIKNGNKYRAVFTNPCCDAITNAATIKIVQSPLCYEVSAGDVFPDKGGSGRLSIVLSAGPAPTATSTADWLKIDSVDTGAASGFASAPGQTDQSATIYYTAEANGSAGGRVGGLKIGAQNITIMQSGANPVASVSAARFNTLPTISADSIVAAFGVGLATSVQIATTVPLPTTLAGTQLKVLDAAGVERLSPLFFVSPNQINYLMPPGTAAGPALVTVTAGNGTVSTGTVQIALVAPGLFTTDSSGRGFPAANALLFRPDNSSTQLPVARFDTVLGRFVAVPLDFGAEGNRLFLVLFGTGIKSRTELAGVTARIGGIDAPVLFADAQGGFVGLDQINIEIPRELVGRGEVDVELTVDGQTVNVVTINVK
ncbi:MAG: FG-GAP-like repeat-containing protein [Acidobacteriota bacterium]